MSAYVIVQETVFDEEMFAAYGKDVPAMIAAHGGRFLVRGGALSVVEGEWKRPRVVVIEFPSRAAAETWYHSPEYQKVLPLRLKGATSDFVIVDGV